MPRKTNLTPERVRKILMFGASYGNKEAVKLLAGTTSGKREARDIANDRWHTAEHIKTNSQPTVVGYTNGHEKKRADSEHDFYQQLADFLFKQGLVRRPADAAMFPTYAVVDGDRVIPYDLRNAGTDDEELVVWI